MCRLNLDSVGLLLSDGVNYSALLLFFALCAVLICGAVYGFFILTGPHNIVFFSLLYSPFVLFCVESAIAASPLLCHPAEHVFQIVRAYFFPTALLVAVPVLGHSAWQYIAFARQRQRLSATQTQCAVCLDSFAGSGEECQTLVCGHKFHRMCVNPWLAQQHCCPLCRLRV